MLNVLRPALSRLLTPVAEALARTPVTPNSITITGTAGVVAGALWLFPIGQLFAGTMVCTGFVLFDMLDGVLARVKGTTGPFGAFPPSGIPPGGTCGRASSGLRCSSRGPSVIDLPPGRGH